MSHVFDIIQPRVPDGLGLYLKSRETGRHYRIEPARHVEQPRFWVLRVVRCQRPGVTDTTFRAWSGSRSFTLSELPAALAEIRADVAEWLAIEDHVSLRAWFENAEQAPLTTLAMGSPLFDSAKRSVPDKAESKPVVESVLVAEEAIPPAKTIDGLPSSEMS